MRCCTSFWGSKGQSPWKQRTPQTTSSSSLSPHSSLLIIYYEPMFSSLLFFPLFAYFSLLAASKVGSSLSHQTCVGEGQCLGSTSSMHSRSSLGNVVVLISSPGTKSNEREAEREEERGGREGGRGRKRDEGGRGAKRLPLLLRLSLLVMCTNSWLAGDRSHCWRHIVRAPLCFWNLNLLLGLIKNKD